MEKQTNPIAGTLKKLIDSKGKKKAAQASSAPDSAGSGKAGDTPLQKLTRLELLEILVDQRKEIDRLQEKLADAESRLERDDALIRKFIGRDHTDFKVRRNVKDE